MNKMKIFNSIMIVAVLALLSGQVVAAQEFELSGIVSGDIQGGVTITLSGNADEATETVSDGTYSFPEVANGDYTVTPSLAGYSFAPANTTVTIDGADVTGVDFVSVADEQDEDIDGDGVINEDDECASTPVNVIVDPSNGCSIEQLVPCNGNWKNHGQYVLAFTQTVKSFMKQKLIAKDEKRALMKEAAFSDCGKYDPFSSSGCKSGGKPASGLITIANNPDSSMLLSNGSERTYYLRLPENYDSKNPYPLVIAFHGTGGSHESFLKDEYYNLQGAVGSEAILVYPNALASGSGVNQWNYAIDIDFFDDVIEDLESRFCYDTRQVFAVGHSSGAGITHELGCLRGNVLRGIAPVAGSLVSNDCAKEVAVMQIHGINDTTVPISTGEQTRDFWVGYNSCNCDETINAEYSDCIQYSDCDPDYPVYWCTHEYDPGHAWPPFAGEAIWDFFKTLTPVDPSLAEPTKGGECTSKETTMMQFSIHFPDDFGTPAGFMAMVLYPPGSEQPLLTQPPYILNFEAELVEYGSGEVFSYSIEGNITGVPRPGEYTFSIIVYMDGGNYPIPTSGLDYVGLTDIHVDTDGKIIIDDPIELELLQSF